MQKKNILFFLVIVLAGLVAARGLSRETAIPVMAEPDAYGYNILSLDLPLGTETVGSAMIAEMNDFFLSRAPTAKNAFTGALSGKNLILICADDWTPDPESRVKNPALHRLAAGSAQIVSVWRPEWYQGLDGRLFALLSGLAPTRVNDASSLAYTGEQNIYLPFSLPRAFSRAGYTSIAFMRDAAYAKAMTALGFDEVRLEDASRADAIETLLAALNEDAPVFIFCVWDGSGEASLARLLDALEGGEHRTDTALCLLTADEALERAQLYLWGAGLSGASSDLPCSELDVAPTLLNAFGFAFI